MPHAPHNPLSVVTFSGGMDSATLLGHLLHEGHRVLALSIHYGQRHSIELDYAARFARHLGVPHEIADLRGLTRLLGGNSLTDPSVPVPHGAYDAQNMKLTIVPNRNMLLLAAATAFAIGQQARYVAYAAHAGDHAIYPDCRPEFADAMATAIGLCDEHPPVLIRPFVNWTKGQIVRRASELGLPLHLTWSCYEGGQVHCGACGTCIERREAFLDAGIPDPTEYAPDAPALTLAEGGRVRADWSHTLHGKPRQRMATDPQDEAQDA